MWRVVLLSLTLFLPGALQAESLRWQLVFASDFNGVLKPCGCEAKANTGGVLRYATRLRQWRKQVPNTILVSAGNLVPDLRAHPDEQARIKARTMLEMHERLHLDAILPGRHELQMTSTQLAGFDLPWVLSNASEHRVVARYREKRIQGRRFVFIGIVDPVMAKTVNLPLDDPDTCMRNALQKAGASDTDVVVLLIQSADKLARRLGSHPLVDVVVRSGLQYQPESDKQREGHLLGAGYMAQAFGLAQLHSNAQTKIVSLSYDKPGPEVADDAQISHLYARYDEAVSAWYRERSRMQTGDRQEGAYAGAQTCRLCHTGIYQHWLQTDHAEALASLNSAGKQNDPECLRCHTTGMGVAGGFVSIDTTAKLADVQCEACHGAAREHSRYPRAVKTAKPSADCRRCHTATQSPSFNSLSYLPRILHRQDTVAPFHLQELSSILGEYQLRDTSRPILDRDPIEVVQFFSFYCSRCFVFDQAWTDLLGRLPADVVSRDVPIVFDSNQPAWPAVAYLAAREQGRGEMFKQALFDARFNKGWHINEKFVVLDIAEQLGILEEVRLALDDEQSNAFKQFRQGLELRERFNVHATPFVLINDNLYVTPQHSADNTNLMVENLQDILLDMQCRQYGNCDVP